MRWIRHILRRSSYPEVFLPIPRGPIHGFYHFFTGYFLPLIRESHNRGSRKQYVIDCGPFNKWFDLLPGGRPEILSQARAIKLAHLGARSGYANGYKVVPIVKWDKWGEFGNKNLKEVQKVFFEDFNKRRLGLELPSVDIVLLGREHTPSFFSTNIPSRYGTAKRNIPNLEELATSLAEKYRVKYVDGANTDPREMVSICQSASLVVGQHGAALSNLFFLPAGAKVLEIVWDGFGSEHHLDMYGQLSGQLGLEWRRVALQSHKFDSVGIDDLMEEISTLIGPPIKTESAS